MVDTKLAESVLRFSEFFFFFCETRPAANVVEMASFIEKRAYLVYAM